MNDIQYTFEHRAYTFPISLVKDENDDYVDEETRKAYHWFRIGYLAGEMM